VDTVRALTLNLWGEQAPLEQRLAIIIDGCRAMAPDLIALQEVRVVPGAVPNTAETIAAALGYGCVFEVATPWGGGDEGLAILSRLPIARRGFAELPHAVATERRIVLGATLETPRGELSVFTTHLNYRLHEGGKREDQVVAADGFVASWTVSPTLPRILMGDFNAVPESDEIRFLRGLHGAAGRRTYWQDAWAAARPEERGLTWSRKNPYTARLGWLEPDRRLDYIFVSQMWKDGRGTVRDCRVVFDDASADGVFASDHFGLLADIQLAPR
jgi:endonuclease/exonuclease/phosphatase family metal-dependent hydrolase